MSRPYPIRANVAECFHGCAMELAQQPTDLHVSRDQLLGRQRRFDSAQDRTLKLCHQDEVETEQLFRVVGKQNARSGDALRRSRIRVETVTSFLIFQCSKSG